MLLWDKHNSFDRLTESEPECMVDLEEVLLVGGNLGKISHSGQLSPLDVYQPRWTKAAFCVSADASRHLLRAGRPIFTSHATCMLSDIYYLR